MSKGYYLICIIFDVFMGIYAFATKQEHIAIIFISILGLNIRWFIRELKEGGADGN